MKSIIGTRQGRWLVTSAFGAALLLLAAPLTLIETRATHAFTLVEQPAWIFGPGLVAVGQNASLGAVNMGDGSVRLEMVLVDAHDTKTVLAHQEVTLEPGIGTFLSFSNAAPGTAAGDPTAVELSAMIAVRSTRGQLDLLRNLGTSLEITDGTSNTTRVHISPIFVPAVQLPAVQ